MHGEYKMPGGKLVVADVDVVHGRLAEARISGDFFIEPDDALDAINGALANLPADSSEAVLVAAIDGALGADVRLYGISALAVAIAVRRALGTPA